MTDFLLELRCEEIPARMQAKASADLARLFGEALAGAGLAPGALTSHVTPRRLALIAHDLPLATQAVREEHKGPRTSAPPQALEGFLRKTGLTQDQLEDRDGVWFATVEKPGRATADLLAEVIPAIVRGFPWPKSMRWGPASLSTESLRWVRPLQGIVALLGNDVVPFAIEGIAAGRETAGHRFHARGPIAVESPATYADQLRAAHVIVDQAERAALIEARAHALAVEAGLTLIPDAGLVAENAGLTEWPVPLLGRFDPAFLEVPPEVIQLTLRINQKYFVLRDAAGALANAFICTANIEAKDGGAAIVAGNGKVLAARLSDARFFWEQDKKTPLADHAKKLARITFHEKLGTVADKVERVAKLARWLVEEGIVREKPLPLAGGVGAGTPTSPSDATPQAHPPAPSRRREGENLADLAEQAARLAKADLVTEMVGEFPELQGLMGGYYARAEGLPDEVADAIRDHYKPVGQGDEVPTAPVTVAVSLADKLDTLFGFYLNDLEPTGSKDPYALRRAQLGCLALIITSDLRVSLAKLFYLASKAFYGGYYLASGPIEIEREMEESFVRYLRSRSGHTNLQVGSNDHRVVDAAFAVWNAISKLMSAMPDRLKVQQREAGVRHDLIDAVFALGGEDDLVRLLARVKALQAFVGTEDGANLLAGYKRAANILKKEDAPSATKPQSLVGEEDPGVALTDPAIAHAIREHDEIAALSYTPEPAEAALIAALDMAGPRADAAIAAEDFEGAMAALATLRGPIDAFFDQVTVNDADPARRQARLSLLTRIRAAVHKVADFSRIEG